MTAKFEDWRRLMSPIPFSSSRKKRKQEEEEEEDPDPPSIRDIPLAVIDKQIEILPNYLSPSGRERERGQAKKREKKIQKTSYLIFCPV